MKKLFATIAVLLLALVGCCFAAPSFEEVRAAWSASDAVLFDRHGEPVEELRIDLRGRRLEWTNLMDISPALVKAVIRSEDKRFYAHQGADWTALFSALIGRLSGKARGGASTISMQLASLLDDRLMPKKRQRSIGQKWDQIRAARELEQSWTKNEILEAYVNLVSFRGELVGIAAASRGIFDKAPAGLDTTEAAILAALIRSPNASPEKVGERASALAAALGGTRLQEDIKGFAVERLSRPYAVRRRIDLAPQAARILFAGGKHRVSSTLDASLQRFAIDALRNMVIDLTGRNAQDGAVLVVDNKTGEVLVYVANAGEQSSASFVDGIRARRQAGSTLKPFLYGQAIERRIITAASLIEDAPLDLPTGRGVYRPQNYDREFRGSVTARDALASSMNIPAVKTLGLVGNDAFVRTLRTFGFGNLREPEYYGPSLALGSADISLWELVNAYRTLANNGVRSDLRLAPHEKRSPSRRALSREAAFIISDILSDREARSETFSLENPLATRFWSAVKTGTSKDMRDNWCVGYSRRYTVGVWVGNFSGASMWNVSGISGAAPLWLEVMNRLQRNVPSMPPAAPPGVVRQKVVIADGKSTKERQEWFLAGTERETVETAAAENKPKIVYPAPDTVIAIDPDIPAEQQRVVLEAAPDTGPIRLTLDGQELDRGPRVAWQPVAGLHRLVLLDGNGRPVDQITFEVR